ncbi:MAG: thioredoxin family protein [Planctomycetota bacterium]|nr:thioredoxin family protein [Planctomycetota bacterium]
MKRTMRDGLMVVVLLVGAGMLVMTLGRGGTAATPPMFRAGLTLEQATSEAAGGDRLVFVYATADWCGPCQAFKRGALSDGQVEAWIEQHAAPVYLDVDERPEEAARLGVRSIPAVFVFDGATLIGRASGVMSASALLEWLEGQREAAHRAGASETASASS